MPLLLRQLMQQPSALFDPGGVVSAIEPSVGLDRMTNQSLDVALRREISGEKRAAEASTGDGAARLLTAIRCDVGHHDIGAGPGQYHRGLAADAATGTGDDDGLTLQDSGH